MLCTALELYTRIPKNERDAEEDVVRCLAEVKEETKQGRCKLKDYFLIAQRKQKVATLIYAQFYPSFKFLFISAFVTILDLVPKEIDIEYVKPRLSLWDDEQREERQHLIYARVAPPIGSEITKHKLEEVMSFLYGETYADQFEDDQAKDAKYREYLGNLKKRVMDGLVGESASMSRLAGHHTAKVMMLQMC